MVLRPPDDFISIAKAAPPPPVRPSPAAAVAILRLSEPSSSKPTPAKSEGSIESFVFPFVAFSPSPAKSLVLTASLDDKILKPPPD